MAGAWSGLSELLRGAVDLALPPLCTACGEYTESPTGFCESCIKRIDRYDYPMCLQCEQPIFSGIVCPQCGEEAMVLYAFGNYVDPLKEAVHQFKFRGVTRVAGYFAEEIAARFGAEIGGLAPAVLVPIPLHPSREHARGFNQAEVFAEALGSRLNLAINSEILIRIKKGKPHSRLSDNARARNIRGAFSVIAEEISKDHVILVDDVVTGGHTVREARSELGKAGFHVPAVISIAHGR
ncbi:hypothetical protein C3F09_01870 [candidate division GN15 bacterium]|uniref:Double zinc ribbon domain-containing protein n=1 Tax=candidate division GN15 bacterium TaxID=2072418 RepID=A0A855X422_9BACT|nr:MAG: hypothetical protein C3F09_01870 [candidate division GN15 bacterium]